MNCSVYLTITLPGKSIQCLELQDTLRAAFPNIDADLPLGASGLGAIFTSSGLGAIFISPFQPGTSLWRRALQRPFLHAVLLSSEKLDKPSWATTNDRLPVICLHMVWWLINFLPAELQVFRTDEVAGPPLGECICGRRRRKGEGEAGGWCPWCASAVTRAAGSDSACDLQPQCFFMQLHASFQPLLSHPDSSLG